MSGILHFHARVGRDGRLALDVPLGPEEADREVVVTVHPVPPSVQTDAAAWRRGIEQTAGSITDPTFERQPQGDFEQREELP